MTIMTLSKFSIALADGLAPITRVTLYTAGHLHTAVPHCSHSRAPIVHTAMPRENNEHGCVYLRCRAVCKLPGCVEGHPWINVWWFPQATLHILSWMLFENSCNSINALTVVVVWLKVLSLWCAWTWRWWIKLSQWSFIGLKYWWVSARKM